MMIVISLIFKLCFIKKQVVSAAPTIDSSPEFDLIEFDEEILFLTVDSLDEYDDDRTDIVMAILHFRCIEFSVDYIVRDTKIVEVASQWEVTKKYLEILKNRMKACKNIEDRIERYE